MTNAYGNYETIDDRPALSFERRLSHPADVVWRAITEPGELEHWSPRGSWSTSCAPARSCGSSSSTRRRRR